MKISIVALALANVAALPVPKASFLRGAREDEDTSSVTRHRTARAAATFHSASTPKPRLRPRPIGRVPLSDKRRRCRRSPKIRRRARTQSRASTRFPPATTSA